MSKSRATNGPHTNSKPSAFGQAADGALPSDMFDYAKPPTRNLGRPSACNQAEWTVTDNWPQVIPVTEIEIDIFEAWFGDVFDEFFGTTQ